MGVLVPLAREGWTPEAVALGDGVVYGWCPGGFADSALMAAIGKALGDGITVRNWATVLKLETLAKQRAGG
jgi:uncharacterized protein (DUF1697 family)